MRTIPVYEATGTILLHDLTQIIPGQFKGSRFKKGYMIQSEDIEVLLSMGKENLYVADVNGDDVHEEAAAMRIALAASGQGIKLVPKGEGKVELVAEYEGLLKIDWSRLLDLIDDDEIMFATIHPDQVVHKGETVAGTRVIPLYVRESQVARAEEFRRLISIKPLKQGRIGIVTTGSEIYHGRIKDGFGPILKSKFDQLGSVVVQQLFSDDQIEMIAERIQQLTADNVDLIAVTGGMSVDPDDRTPAGIRRAGAIVETYGAPVLPGAMFLLAYIKRADGQEIPLVGLPGCVMYHGASIFDLVIPRLLAGEKVIRKDLKRLMIGGLCRHCEVCSFPNCSFGKGVLHG
jgi:hypothetical protein